MQPRQLTPEQLRQLADLARQWGKKVVQQAGEQHDLFELSFHDLEAIARAAADGLRQATLEQLTQNQADQLEEHQPCPGCQRPCLVQRRPRQLQVEGGTSFQLDEPFAHCPACRRDFFPPTDSTGARQP